jgi:FlaA1/EpsC-like NDP-sugar epimerase
VDVRFTGARPGEKLYEELFFGAEQAEATEHPKVVRATGTHLYEQRVTHLRREIAILWGAPDVERLREMIDSLVDDYRLELATAAEML